MPVRHLPLKTILQLWLAQQEGTVMSQLVIDNFVQRMDKRCNAVRVDHILHW